MFRTEKEKIIDFLLRNNDNSFTKKKYLTLDIEELLKMLYKEYNNPEKDCFLIKFSALKKLFESSDYIISEDLTERLLSNQKIVIDIGNKYIVVIVELIYLTPDLENSIASYKSISRRELDKF